MLACEAVEALRIALRDLRGLFEDIYSRCTRHKVIRLRPRRPEDKYSLLRAIPAWQLSSRAKKLWYGLDCTPEECACVRAIGRVLARCRESLEIVEKSPGSEHVAQRAADAMRSIGNECLKITMDIWDSDFKVLWRNGVHNRMGYATHEGAQGALHADEPGGVRQLRRGPGRRAVRECGVHAWVVERVRNRERAGGAEDVRAAQFAPNVGCAGGPRQLGQLDQRGLSAYLGGDEARQAELRLGSSGLGS